MPLLTGKKPLHSLTGLAKKNMRDTGQGARGRSRMPRIIPCPVNPSRVIRDFLKLREGFPKLENRSNAYNEK
ncbi:hypothetical protein C7R92_27510 [Brevibacillus porteri]|uniref:Uncharacterized protein n=1 Tax=Brevibacillus porteri TaxID=2126350 RepID=A0ABX5FI06_9BACL|nr:hypothetical protein C7R92_27510 [Brevibacillus porteri]